MAENPKFNNSDMFKNVEDSTHYDIDTNNNSEVLATQGNVINSIKTFWNNLRKKLAYAISRPEYRKQVGGNYVPIFVDANGVVRECQPTTIQADIANTGIITIHTNDIPNDNIYTGTTVCISFSNNYASGSNNNLQIEHNNSTSPVKYPSGVTVLAKDMSNAGLLLATFCNTSISSSNNFWILLNKINTVVSTGQTTPDNNNVDGGHPGLMTAKDKAKLETIEWSANNYSLPKAGSEVLGGIQLGYTNEGQNYKLQTDNNGNGYVNVPWTDTVYSLPTANADNLGGVKSSITGKTPNRDYKVQVDSDGTMKVNVPWTDNNHYTAYLCAGNNNSIANGATTNTNTYLKIVDGGNVSSKLKISGKNGTKVTSDDNGNITIESPKVTSYNKLSNFNNDKSIGYVIAGPGPKEAKTSFYLAGNGTWQEGILVPIPTEGDKTLKSHADGTVSWE